jgi:hypothetical protein
MMMPSFTASFSSEIRVLIDADTIEQAEEIAREMELNHSDLQKKGEHWGTVFYDINEFEE